MAWAFRIDKRKFRKFRTTLAFCICLTKQNMYQNNEMIRKTDGNLFYFCYRKTFASEVNHFQLDFDIGPSKINRKMFYSLS